MKTYIITGRPGSGKSTLFMNIIKVLENEGFIVGGIKAPEVRGADGYRIGFKVIDLLDGEEAWLAKKNYPSPIRIGRYGVLEREAGRIIAKALQSALERADIIGVDEVGPMELKISVFRKLLLEVLDSSKPKILVIHYRLNDPIILSKIKNAEKYIVTLENREELNRVVPNKIASELKRILR